MTHTTVTEVRRMSPQDLWSCMRAGERVNVLDARAPQAWDDSTVKIAGAIRVDPQDLRIDSSWPKVRTTVLYCT